MDEEHLPGLWGQYGALTPEQEAALALLPEPVRAEVRRRLDAQRAAVHDLRATTGRMLADLRPTVQSFEDDLAAAPEGSGRDVLVAATAAMISGLMTTQALHDGVRHEDIWSVENIVAEPPGPDR